MNEDTFAQLLVAKMYTSYCDAVGGVAFNGDPLPDWATFSADPAKRKQANGWIKCAQTAVSEIRDFLNDTLGAVAEPEQF